MINIFLPILPVAALFLFAISHNKKVGREIIWKGNLRKNIFSLILIIIIFGGGVYYILDPNEMGRSVSTTSYQYLYTGGRMIGFALITIAYTLFHFLFLNSGNLRTKKVMEGRYQEKNIQWIGYKIIFILICVTAIISGTYGFVLRSCWGLFQSRYIYDTFMWWAELGWCIAGIIGLFCYFKYMRFWDGEEDSNQ